MDLTQEFMDIIEIPADDLSAGIWVFTLNQLSGGVIFTAENRQFQERLKPAGARWMFKFL